MLKAAEAPAMNRAMARTVRIIVVVVSVEEAANGEDRNRKVVVR